MTALKIQQERRLVGTGEKPRATSEAGKSKDRFCVSAPEDRWRIPSESLECGGERGVPLDKSEMVATMPWYHLPAWCSLLLLAVHPGGRTGRKRPVATFPAAAKEKLMDKLVNGTKGGCTTSALLMLSREKSLCGMGMAPLGLMGDPPTTSPKDARGSRGGAPRLRPFFVPRSRIFEDWARLILFVRGDIPKYGRTPLGNLPRRILVWKSWYENWPYGTQRYVTSGVDM